MSAKVIYIILAAIAAIIAAITVLERVNTPVDKPAPLPAGMTQQQADEYRNAARRTDFQKSKPGKYEWTAPGK